MTRTRRTAALLLLAVTCACGKPESAQVGKDVGDVGADTATLREASAAVNEVVRNAGDCDAAKASLPAATAKVEEASRRVRTSTGQVTLDALRSQLRNVASNCP